MKTTQNLTDKLIQNVKTDKPRLQITDAKTVGLKLRVSRSGHKSFAMMIRNSTGKYATYTIGSYPDVSLRKAREIALQIRVDLKINGASTPTPPSVTKKEKLTLRELLNEVQPIFAKTKKSWRPRGGASSSLYTRNTIERVFCPLLDKPIETLTAEEFGLAANAYKPIRPINGKTTANGQVSRALSYLAPVLDWASHRGRKFGKIGAGRPIRLNAPELRRIHDPATDDPTIVGKRERVLNIDEIAAIFPLLRYPAPQEIRRRNMLPENDYGPVAMRFMLLTLARREEVAAARWQDIDFTNGVWIKHEVKDTTGAGRSQRLPLSYAALELLKQLQGLSNVEGEAFVFPNRDGGKLDNWNRIAEQIQKGSKTSGWTRHDLRRTGATLLEELQVPIQTIEAILDHSNRFANAGVSGSAGHYMIATRILNESMDPKVVALNKLSDALNHIVQSRQPPQTE
jgi:integrase